MNLIDALLGEHGLFHRLFQEIEDELSDSSSNDFDTRSALVTLTRGLTSHAHLEDSLLFPELERHVGPDGPLACMRSEHHELESLLASALQPGPDEQRKRTVHRMLALAREHFGKEERILFPLARDVIPVDVLVELGKRWALRSTVTLSPAGD